MSSYALSFWLAGVALEGTILSRALVVGWFKKCPFFFVYLASVFVQDVFFLAVYSFKFRYYRPIYWYAEFFSLLMGCGVTWEIFRLILGRYPGAGRMARNVLATVFLVVLSKGLVGIWNGDTPWGVTFVELERNLRAVQGLSLIVLALLIAYYRVPLGRYAKGIFAGYGIFIATTVMTLTLRHSMGRAFQDAWVFMQPHCYAVCLGIWCVFLWSEEPSPVEQSHSKIEDDYQGLALLTRRSLVQAREFLGRAIHS
jgi:hypothetical protein